MKSLWASRLRWATRQSVPQGSGEGSSRDRLAGNHRSEPVRRDAGACLTEIVDDRAAGTVVIRFQYSSCPRRLRPDPRSDRDRTGLKTPARWLVGRAIVSGTGGRNCVARTAPHRLNNTAHKGGRSGFHRRRACGPGATEGAQVWCARADLEHRHRRRLDRSGLQPGRDARLRRRRHRSAGSDRHHPRLHPDVLHLGRLPGDEQGRP